MSSRRGRLEVLLHAPTSRVVAIRVTEAGEAVVAGEPVLTMVPSNGLWFGFNVREDALRGIAVGSSVPSPCVRALALKPSARRLVGMRNWGEFATWRAARASGDHDLNTFFLRLDPDGPVHNLAAGQTGWLTAGARVQLR